jgi:chemotaxis protein CheD
MATPPQPNSPLSGPLNLQPGGSRIVVGVADCRVTTDPEAHVITYALGSCLGITLHDDVRKVGGLLHVMLPDSHLHNGQRVREAMFVDTGVPMLINMMLKAGASRNNMKCKVFGGAQVMSADQYFRIGSKNIDAFYALSREYDLNTTVWEVSGRVNRTIRLINQTGEVVVKVPAKPDFIR